MTEGQRANIIRSVILASLAMSPASAAFAQDAAPQKPASQTKELAAALGGKDEAARDAAREKLSGMLAQAQTAADTAAKAQGEAEVAVKAAGDAAAKEAAKKKLVEISRQAGEAAATAARVRTIAEMAMMSVDGTKSVAGTNVTLDLADSIADLAIAELATQTGYDIRMMPENYGGGGGPLKTITVEVAGAPFWAVFKDVCQQSGLSIYNRGDESRGLRLIPASRGGQDLYSCPASINGAFMVIAQQVNRQNNANLSSTSGGKIDRSLSVQFTVMAEPKVRMNRYYTEVNLDEAVDDAGNSLLIDRSNRGGGGYGGTRGIMWNTSAQLKYPEKPGTKITKLRGSLKAKIISSTETVEVDKIAEAKDVTVAAGTTKMTVKGMTKNGERNYSVEATFNRGGGDTQKFQEMMNNPSFKLVDAKGGILRSNGYSGGGGTQNERKYTLQFYRGNGEDGEEAPGDPVKLIWEAPATTADIDIPFEFVDLPLP